MDPEIALKYAVPVPRYTSYPTAPHFHNGVDGTVYLDWLAALPAGASLSAYFHIPYCDTLCWFCGCHTKIVRRYEPIKSYLTLLERELELILPKVRGRLSHLHFGGGSPSLLKPDDVLRFGAVLREHVAFDPDGEFAIEIDPRETERAQIDAWAEIGLNRASLGLQDFNPMVQRAINRVQSFEETERVVDWLRDSGITGINFDLMYGLPHQSLDDVAQSIARALTLRPERVALFGYAHVPWMKKHQTLISEDALPDASARLAQSRLAASLLVDAGYLRIGLDHFVRADDSMAVAWRTGRLRRNFQGYTVDAADALFGFGASAIGALPQGYVQNHVPIGQYRRAVTAGEPAIAKGIALSADDRLRRAVIERLMCDLKVDIAAECRRAGSADQTLDGELVALEEMVDDGIVEVEGRNVTITEPGRELMRSVCAVFDEYLACREARHSIAV